VGGGVVIGLALFPSGLVVGGDIAGGAVGFDLFLSGFVGDGDDGDDDDEGLTLGGLVVGGDDDDDDAGMANGNGATGTGMGAAMGLNKEVPLYWISSSQLAGHNLWFSQGLCCAKPMHCPLDCTLKSNMA